MNQLTNQEIEVFRGSESLSNEEWKEAVNFPNYEISSHGRVRRKKDGTLLKTYKVNGYLKTKLSNDGVRKAVRVHRLLMLTFRPIEKSFLFEVDHIDFVRDNNLLTNLRWVKTAENRKRKQG